MSHNPYAPPRAPVSDGDAPADGAPRTRFYSPAQIGVATFLGGLIPGAQLASANLRLMGRPVPALWTFVIGIVAMLVLLLASSSMSPGVSIFLSLVVGAGAFSIARTAFGSTCRAHVEAGGRLHSWWRVVGISVAWGLSIGFAVGVISYLVVGPTAVNPA